ncbi:MULTISPECIES: hypothetical protein [Dactylosporangium]|uniref:Uncharacterized protein n=2 Tax=Dactylosporangium TaxID=35753 RepID=A0A9W6KGI2_9ACTN|nr:MULTISPECIES: hypothetical protein [Dactylosporangium]UAB99292.1 hypothetical protein Dvina_15155 [Dactylosporangium vinaceum]UWZ47522.1 hypothetical protein Dmats_14605 [Dactylosporangium matsuzakiense]GLL01652.1 hypothetical protein GCM10017581_033940 [Dactylosporangium matsuzakiense]
MNAPHDGGAGVVGASAVEVAPAPGPTTAGLGSRVVALIGAIAALLALALPWAREDNTVTVETNFGASTLLQRGGDVWSGWTLHGASRLDGHRPITVAMAMLLITATLVLVGAAWTTFERPRAIWVAPTMAGVALLTLAISMPGLDGVAGKFGAGHVTTPEFGLVVWRTALAVVVVGATRLALLQEASRRRLR